MNSYFITVDGKYYAGESENTEQSDYGGDGWNVNSHNRRNKLSFANNEHEANIIEGSIHLKSHIGRILSRIKDGTLEANEITIKLVYNKLPNEDTMIMEYHP